MMKRYRRWLTAGLLVLAACQGNPPDTAEDAGAAVLPPGHPDVSTTALSPPPGSGVGAAALRWVVPERWREVAPTSSMRRAQYEIDGDAGTAECVVFYFGPGQGGDALSNANRWVGQFQGPDGQTTTDASIEERAGGAGSVVVIEARGTYDGGMVMTGAPPAARDDWALLGAVVGGPDANWFFKCTGPRETVAAMNGEFEELLASIRTSGAEQP